ncbi:MAG TPA: thymidine kinase [Candidatus Colwellbacteria bacterium]|nr:thymidine kinase [Candidatus Colwellbacteria bacterium]
MGLIMILGPMKSGKSFEMISRFIHLKYTALPYGLFQSSRNVRNENVWSRNGLSLEAIKVDNLDASLRRNYRIVGVDEIHMFAEEEVKTVEELLNRGTDVIVSGLDSDYRGRMFPIIRGLLELGPTEVHYKKAVCEICKSPDAIYTQIFSGEQPVVEGLPPVVPDDGGYVYKSVCRKCFVRKLDRIR